MIIRTEFFILLKGKKMEEVSVRVFYIAGLTPTACWWSPFYPQPPPISGRRAPVGCEDTSPVFYLCRESIKGTSDRDFGGKINVVWCCG